MILGLIMPFFELVLTSFATRNSFFRNCIPKILQPLTLPLPLPALNKQLREEVMQKTEHKTWIETATASTIGSDRATDHTTDCSNTYTCQVNFSDKALIDTIKTSEIELGLSNIFTGALGALAISGRQMEREAQIACEKWRERYRRSSKREFGIDWIDCGCSRRD